VKDREIKKGLESVCVCSRMEEKVCEKESVFKRKFMREKYVEER
jgi:hypothetical protein